MPESTPPMAKIMVQTLIKGLEEAKTSLQNLQAQVHANEITSVGVKNQLDNISEDVSEIVDLIRGNNGKKSIVDRINTLENDQKVILDYINNQKEQKKEDGKSAAQIKVAIIASSAGIITAISSIVFHFLK